MFRSFGFFCKSTGLRVAYAVERSSPTSRRVPHSMPVTREVIFLKKARVSEFNGAKSLSSPAGMQHSRGPERGRGGDQRGYPKQQHRKDVLNSDLVMPPNWTGVRVLQVLVRCGMEQRLFPETRLFCKTFASTEVRTTPRPLL